MVDNTDLDFAIAVALAESNEGFSDDDFKPSMQKVVGLNQQHAFNTCRVLPKKKQQKKSKKKPDKTEEEKDNGLVAIDLSGDGDRQEKVQKKQITERDSVPRQSSTIDDSDSVKRRASRSMAELDSYRFVGGFNASSIGKAVPCTESELKPVNLSTTDSNRNTEMPEVENFCRSDSATEDAREECFVIDIDTDEVVELSDETQFSILLRLCGEECEQDDFRTDVPDVDRVPTLDDGSLGNSVPIFEQPPKSISNRGGRPGCDSLEGIESTEVDIVSANLIETVSEVSVQRDLLAEEIAIAPVTDVQETYLPVIQEGNGVEEKGSQDEFDEDFISLMMTQKCFSQPEEVKAPKRTSRSPLQNISNLPARLDTNKRRVIQMKPLNQAASRMDSKESSAPDKNEPVSVGVSIAQVPQLGESRESSEGHFPNKENVGGSPSPVIRIGDPSVSGNAMEYSGILEDHEPVVEDVLWYSGEVSVTIKCPVCGENISEISVEERLAHSNSCLDKLDTVQGSPQEEPYRSGPSLVAATDQVREWLEKLNLSRYVSLFVEQEIDWDTLPWLTEEDLMVMGVAAIGPRRRIFQAIQDLKGGSSGIGIEPQEVPLAPSSAVENTGTIQIPIPADSISRIQQIDGGDSNNLITNYFPLPLNSGKEQLPDKSLTNMVHRTGVVRNKTSKRPRSSVYQNPSGVPAWMCIPGTPFRVDAFQHLSGNCSHWFLTHFHTDHYQGLTRGFRYGHIFCSTITARLVHLRIGVSWEKLMIIPLHEKVKIAGVDVTFIDANHCPGSVMILFEPPNGEAVLHTGDFRFCPEMANNPLLQTVKIHTLVLDTTYCDPQYDFPTQETVIRFVIEAIQAEMFNSDTLFLIGTYTIGKERVFLEVAKVLKKYVYVGAPKKKLLDCMDLSADDTKWITCNEQESFIHVVPLWSISSFKRMNAIARHYQGRYKLIVAFSPSGWSFGRGKKKTPGKRWKQGTMIRYEVPYSEHCSFPELREFLRFIGPEDIIPSVPSKDGVGADAMIASLWSEDQ